MRDRQLPDGIVVLANSYWQARRHSRRSKWNMTWGPGGLDSAEVSRRLAAGLMTVDRGAST